MKRLWIGVGLLALVLVGGIWAADWMGNTHHAMAAELDRAAELALTDRWEEAEAQVERLAEEWQKKRPVTAAFADHEPLEEIDGLFAQLRIYGALGRKGDFAGGCVYLARQLEALGENHSVTLSNLL